MQALRAAVAASLVAVLFLLQPLERPVVLANRGRLVPFEDQHDVNPNLDLKLMSVHASYSDALGHWLQNTSKRVISKESLFGTRG